LQRGRTRQQVEALKDEADLAVADLRQLVLVEQFHIDTVEQVAPCRLHVEAADDAHQRALTGAGRAHDRDVVALVHRQGYAAQRVHRCFTVAIGLRQLP